MHWEDGIWFYFNKCQYLTLEFFTWIYTLQDKIKTIPYFKTTKKNWWQKNFGFADWFFDMSLTRSSSVLVPLTSKFFVGCQVGWRKVVYYFVEKCTLDLIQSLGIHLPNLFPGKLIPRYYNRTDCKRVNWQKELYMVRKSI